MRHWTTPRPAAITLTLAGCGAMVPSRPASWAGPEALVAPSSFSGVHGLAVDKQGRLLAGNAVGDALWEMDVAGVKAPRLIAKKPGGFTSLHKPAIASDGTV